MIKGVSCIRCIYHISDVYKYWYLTLLWLLTPAKQDVRMGWKQAGITVFTFAAPSAVMAVPFAIGNAGFVGGMLLCLIITGH